MIINTSRVIGIYLKIFVQVQLIRDDNSPWSDWVIKKAIVRPIGPSILWLSGVGIREVLYLATELGNYILAISAIKSGLTSLL